jgi:Ca-activated chloride channel family protein
LVLDVSRSMEARDVKPNRIGAAKRAIRLFLENAPERLRVGMVVFAGVPQVASPPTTDHTQVSGTLDNLGNYATFGGTAIGDALSMAVDVGKEALERDRSDPETAPTTPEEEKDLVSILFLSDGAQREGVLQPLEGAQLAKDASMPVFTVALGTPNGTVPGGGGGFFPFAPERIPVPPDPETLRAIAETTGGEFTEARTADVLDNAYEKLGANIGRKEAEKEVTYLFLAAAAGLLVAAGALSALWSPRLP